MRRSEYGIQAYINDGLNQQQGLDSQEGSAALLQANKPEVDGTDIQKARILGNTNDKQGIVQSLAPENLMKSVSRHKSPIQTTKTVTTEGKMKAKKLSLNDNIHRTH